MVSAAKLRFPHIAQTCATCVVRTPAEKLQRNANRNEARRACIHARTTPLVQVQHRNRRLSDNVDQTMLFKDAKRMHTSCPLWAWHSTGMRGPHKVTTPTWPCSYNWCFLQSLSFLCSCVYTCHTTYVYLVSLCLLQFLLPLQLRVLHFIQYSNMLLSHSLLRPYGKTVIFVCVCVCVLAWLEMYQWVSKALKNTIFW